MGQQSVGMENCALANEFHGRLPHIMSQSDWIGFRFIAWHNTFLERLPFQLSMLLLLRRERG